MVVSASPRGPFTKQSGCFKEDIIERTRNGESCAKIADALMAKGVQTSYRAVNRRRLLWGLRKRTSRKNLKAPPLDVAGRDMRNKSPRYNKTHPERAAVMRRLELTRLTKEGLSAQEILDHFSARGVVWKRGIPSILNLQTRWGLISPQDNPRYVSSKTSQAMKAARKEQKAAFMEIAQDLGVENTVEWVGTKLKEPASKEARTKLAREKAGSLAPPLKYTKDGKPGRLTGMVAWRSRTKKKQQNQRHDTIELLDDGESEDQSSSESSSEEEAPPPRILRSGVVDIAAKKARARDSSSESDSESDEEEVTPREVVPRKVVPKRVIGQEPALHETHVSDDYDFYPATINVDNHGDTSRLALDNFKPWEAEEDDDDSDSAGCVAARVFARIGKTIPKATGLAPRPIPLYPARAAFKPRK